MAKYFRQITLSLLVIMLSIGCGSQVRSNSLFEVSGKSAVNWADQYNRTDPPSLTVYIETDSYAEEPHQISSPDVINQVFDALSDVTIGKKAKQMLLTLPILFVSPMQMAQSRTLFFLRMTASELRILFMRQRALMMYLLLPISPF